MKSRQQQGPQPKRRERQVDSSGRRMWDKEEYERLAVESKAEEEERKRARGAASAVEDEEGGGVIRPRERAEGMPEEGRGEGEGEGGFHCEACGWRCMDSASWVEHLNGMRHQKSIGRRVRPEQSTAANVREKLRARTADAAARRKRESAEGTFSAAAGAASPGTQQPPPQKCSKKEGEQRKPDLLTEEEKQELEVMALGLPCSFASSKGAQLARP